MFMGVEGRSDLQATRYALIFLYALCGRCNANVIKLAGLALILYNPCCLTTGDER